MVVSKKEEELTSAIQTANAKSINYIKPNLKNETGSIVILITFYSTMVLKRESELESEPEKSTCVMSRQLIPSRAIQQATSYFSMMSK